MEVRHEAGNVPLVSRAEVSMTTLLESTTTTRTSILFAILQASSIHAHCFPIWSRLHLGISH